MRRTRFTRPGLMAMQPKAWGMDLEERTADRGFKEIGDAAVVEIRGPLLSRAEGFLSLFCDDYESIRMRVDAALDSASARVILRIDSPGGDAGGVFELARELRAMCESHGKPVLAYCENFTASAAYAIACAADTIITSPTAYVGSIGVFEPMVDWTAQTRAMGINVVIVSSGEYKTDRNPDVAITDDAISRVQAQVDQFAGLFFELVAELRGGSPEDYRTLKGGVFLGSAALGVGLVDAVSGWSDVLAGSAGTEGTTMKTNAAAKDPFQTAKDALRAVVDDEKASEDEREKARKSLRALEAEPEKKEEGEGEGEADKEEGEGKAKAAEDEDKYAKSKAEEEKKKDDEMKALASNSVAMARELQELKAQNAERERREQAAADAKMRADLFAKRPDFSEAQRKTLAHVSLDALKDAVEKWPRVSAAPGAAANALVPGGGEPPARPAYQPRLSAEEQALLDKCTPKAAGPKAAILQGNVLQMPTGISQEDARARLAQLEKELV